MSTVFRLCRRAAGTLPVWHGKADVRQVSSALLPARTPRASSRHHALRRAAHVVEASADELAALVGQLSQGTCDLNSSMPFATGRHGHFRFGKRFKLRYFDAKFAGFGGQFFPGERPRPLRGELVAQPRRLMVVAYDEMLAGRQFDERFDEERMFAGAVEFAHVQHSVRADVVFSGHDFSG